MYLYSLAEFANRGTKSVTQSICDHFICLGSLEWKEGMYYRKYDMEDKIQAVYNVSSALSLDIHSITKFQ